MEAMKPRILSALVRPCWSSLNRPTTSLYSPLRQLPKPTSLLPSPSRTFSTSPIRSNWLIPKRGHKVKSRKGRCRVPTGGSMRGTTVVWGDYGLRMCDHDRRVSAGQLQIGAETIKKRLRGYKYKLYTRICANIGVYTSGNEVRMGKGKGTFDHFASRVAVSKIIFELKGELHEQVVRDAFRLAGAKMPGQYEFVKKGEQPVMGITKMEPGKTLEDMKHPKLVVPLDATTIPITSISTPESATL